MKFGTLTSRPVLPLPLPLAFASGHPGPAEVFDVVRSFSNSWAAGELLRDSTFGDTNAPGVIAVHFGSVHGGMAWKVVSAANGGMGEFRFEWVEGKRLYSLSVIGAKLTLTEARLIALQAGAH